ncbi:MAG TPA: hypothetical protein VGQ62_12810 [Chloroflexota bacterium]|nr:hypothetical protein [Chloroflexota bacterium]
MLNIVSTLTGGASGSMDNDTLLHSLAGGAIITAAFTFARLLLEYGSRASDRRVEHDDRRHQQQRDAEARLERVLQDRLAEADRRLDRLQQAHELLVQQYACLQSDYERLCRARGHQPVLGTGADSSTR